MPTTYNINQSVYDTAVGNVTDETVQTDLQDFASENGYTGLDASLIQVVEKIAWDWEDESNSGEGLAVLAALPNTQPPRHRPTPG